MDDKIINEYVAVLKKFNESVEVPSNFRLRFERALESVEESMSIAKTEEIDKKLVAPLKQIHQKMKQYFKMIK
jgi:hypothetical protein